MSNPKSMPAYHFVAERVDGEARVSGALTWFLPDGSKMMTQHPTKVVPKTRIEG